MHPARLLSCLALLLVTARPSSLHAGSAVPLVPAAGLWTVRVDAGTPTGPAWHFLVDTGTTQTVVSTSAARTIGLVVTPGSRLLTPAGPVAVGQARLPVLGLGDRVRRDVPVLVADLSALGRDPRIDGILGMDVLDADRIVLDLALGQLTLVDGASDHIARRGTAQAVRYLGGRLVVDVNLDGRVHGLVLDSGASTTVLYAATSRGAAVDVRSAGGAVSGRTRRTELSVGRLALGPVSAVHVAPPAMATGAAGLLPATLFARIDIDRRAGVVRLQPRR